MKRALLFMIFLAAVGIALGAAFGWPWRPSDKGLRAYEAEREALPVRLGYVSTKIGGFGTVLIGDFSIVNERFDPVHDVTIECECAGGSGTHLSTVVHTIFQSFGPMSTTEFADVSLGSVHPQASRIECRVVKFRR